LGQSNPRPTAKRNLSLLGAFAEESEHGGIEIDITKPQCAHLGDTSTGAIEDFEHRPITQSDSIVSLHRIQQRLDLGLGESFGKTGGNSRSLNPCRGIGIAESLLRP
jgi:serine/threonine protein phosphatase PrpC